MGGEYTTRTYDGKLSKDAVRSKVASDTEEMGYESGHGYSGTWVEKGGNVDFNSTTFKSESDADDWLCENNDKWGNVGACYFEQKLGTDTQNAKIDTQRAKVRTTESSVNVFLGQVLTKNKNVKAKTKKCKSCGTVHQVTNIGVRCSNCNNIFLTETEAKKLDKIKANIVKEQTKLKTMIAKRGGKTEKGWLVGGWCSS